VFQFKNFGLVKSINGNECELLNIGYKSFDFFDFSSEIYLEYKFVKLGTQDKMFKKKK